jgi:hypothetical protein
MDNQINELSKGEKTSENPNRYNPRSKNKEENNDTSDQPTKTKSYSKAVVAGKK